jgi:alpha-tubulin suppressor-like RCC1 family protein
LPVSFPPSEIVRIAVNGLQDRFAISGRGTFHTGATCAYVEPRGVVCWGVNDSGQLGVGDTEPRGGTAATIPALVNPAWPTSGSGRDSRPITSLCVGRSHACAIQEGVGLRCWGSNSVGQLGHVGVASIGIDDTPLDHPPVPFGPGRDPVSVGCGDRFTCVLLSDGDVVCFGTNANGRLGQGRSTADLADSRDIAPAELEVVDIGEKVHGLSVGYAHACVVTGSGRVRCWGQNGSGRLGLGHTRDIGLSPNDMPPPAVVFQ